MLNIGCEECNGFGIVDVETGVEWMGQKEYRQELCECVHRTIEQRDKTIAELKKYAKLLEHERSRAEMDCADKDAEIQRLRGVLEEIATEDGHGAPVYNSGEMFDMAREALEDDK